MPEQLHFAHPFAFGPAGESPKMVEQDSDDEIETCVENILRYRIGFREDLPGFGIPNFVGDDTPVDFSIVVKQILKFEPRAAVLVSENPERLEQMIENIIVENVV